MAKHRISVGIRCPLYKHENTSVIYCRGIDDETTTHVAFANKTACKLYKEWHCKDDYRRCKYYQMLSSK